MSNHANFPILYKENVYMETFLWKRGNIKITSQKLRQWIFFFKRKYYLKIRYSKFNLQTERDSLNKHWDKITYLKFPEKSLVQFKVWACEETQNPQENEFEADCLCKQQVLKCFLNGREK